MKKNLKYQEGQFLLLLVMLMATVITIVMTVIFTTRTETKITKLEQDSQRSLTAAEAGIEAAIAGGASGNPTFDQLQASGYLGSLSGIDVSNSNIQVDTTSRNYFVSPVIPKDNQYTLYLAPYNNGNFGTSTLDNSTLTVFYGNFGTDSSTCDTVAIEFTLVTGNSPTYTVKRYLADTGYLFDATHTSTTGYKLSTSQTFGSPSVTFYCGADISIPAGANAKILFVRLLGDASGSRIGVNNNLNLPAQGKYILSQAKTTTGVTKKVQLFQSYPQLPAEFFVTSFGQ